MDYYIYKIFRYKTNLLLYLSAKKIQKAYRNYKLYKIYINKKKFKVNNNRFNKIYYDKINLYYKNCRRQNMIESSIYNYWI